MNEALSWIGAISGLIALAVAAILRRGAHKYVDEKARNLATRQDTARITEEVEAVKALHLRQSHAWKWIFEKEYEILRDVWECAWELQATGRSLRPILDHLPEDEEEKKKVYRKRYDIYSESAVKFQNTVQKNQPFIPPSIYKKCLELRSIVIELQVDFEITFEEHIRADWKKIHKCGKKLDEKLAELNESIRKHVHGIVRDAQQGIEPDAYGAS